MTLKNPCTAVEWMRTYDTRLFLSYLQNLVIYNKRYDADHRNNDGGNIHGRNGLSNFDVGLKEKKNNNGKSQLLILSSHFFLQRI